MRVLLVDDEAPARDRLRRQLSEIAGVEIAGEAANGGEALKLIRSSPPDVVLLDIRMPLIDGLETARHLSGWESAPAIIFTTAYGDYALEAFDAQAIDYLLKPIRQERLALALDRAKRLNQNQLEALPERRARTHLSVSLHGNLELIPVTEILYLRADQKYVVVRHRNGEALTEEALKTLEEEFAERFVRIHRSTLIAREALSGMESDGSGHFLARLQGCEERLEISRRHAPEIRRLLKQR